MCFLVIIAININTDIFCQSLPLQSGEGKCRLSQKYAFINKSKVFTRSLRNFAKIGYLQVPFSF